MLLDLEIVIIRVFVCCFAVMVEIVSDELLIKENVRHVCDF